MKSSLKKLEIWGIIFVFVFGTLLHFFYDWSGKMSVVGIISPINESVWEHLKLVLYPTLIYAVFEYFMLKSKDKNNKNFWTATLLNIIAAMVIIVIIFYTYTAFTGHSILYVDIASFLLAIVIGRIISYMLIKAKKLPPNANIISIALIIFLILLFTQFTFYPPALPIFTPPEL